MQRGYITYTQSIGVQCTTVTSLVYADNRDMLVIAETSHAVEVNLVYSPRANGD